MIFFYNREEKYNHFIANPLKVEYSQHLQNFSIMRHCQQPCILVALYVEKSILCKC